jgi:hypothetical protein
VYINLLHFTACLFTFVWMNFMFFFVAFKWIDTEFVTVADMASMPR